MKRLIVLAIVLSAVGLVSAKDYKKWEFYDLLDPESRQKFAKIWLETSQAFYASQKTDSAKACLMYANELYPMGESAVKARELLKEYFGEILIYDPDEYYKYWINRGDKLKDNKKKLNNYLMALEARPDDPNALYKTALTYYELEDMENAKKYLKQAIEKGLDPETVDSALQSLL